MVKRKVEFNPGIVSYIEESGPGGRLSADPTSVECKALVTNPTEGVASCHISPPPATVVEVEGTAANDF